MALQFEHILAGERMRRGENQRDPLVTAWHHRVEESGSRSRDRCRQAARMAVAMAGNLASRYPHHPDPAAARSGGNGDDRLGGLVCSGSHVMGERRWQSEGAPDKFDAHSIAAHPVRRQATSIALFGETADCSICPTGCRYSSILIRIPSMQRPLSEGSACRDRSPVNFGPNHPAACHLAVKGEQPYFGMIASLTEQGLAFDFQASAPESHSVGSKARLDFDFQDQHFSCDSLLVHIQGQRALLTLKEAPAPMLAALHAVTRQNTPESASGLSMLQIQHAARAIHGAHENRAGRLLPTAS